MTLKGYRKWSVATLALLCGFALALLHALTAEFVSLTIAVVGAFHVGNAYETKQASNGGS